MGRFNEISTSCRSRSTSSKAKYASDDFIVGYRLSPEEQESPGITMEITQLVELLAEQPIDYIHISTMHVHGETREVNTLVKNAYH